MIIHILVNFSLMSFLIFANLSLLSFFISWKTFPFAMSNLLAILPLLSFLIRHFSTCFAILLFLSIPFFANMPTSSGVSQASVRCLCLGTVRPRPRRPSSPPPTTTVTTSLHTQNQNKKKQKQSTSTHPHGNIAAHKKSKQEETNTITRK